MPTPTYVPLANYTLPSSFGTFSFTNIPNTYRDLVIVTTTSQAVAGSEMRIRFNSDSGSNYPIVYAGGYGIGTPFSGGSTAPSQITPSATVGESGTMMVTMHILDYAQTNKHKPGLVRSHDVTASGLQMQAFRWASTAAITSVSFISLGGSLAAGSTFAIYGVHA